MRIISNLKAAEKFRPKPRLFISGIKGVMVPKSTGLRTEPIAEKFSSFSGAWNPLLGVTLKVEETRQSSTASSEFLPITKTNN